MASGFKEPEASPVFLTPPVVSVYRTSPFFLNSLPPEMQKPNKRLYSPWLMIYIRKTLMFSPCLRKGKGLHKPAWGEKSLRTQ